MGCYEFDMIDEQLKRPRLESTPTAAKRGREARDGAIFSTGLPLKSFETLALMVRRPASSFETLASLAPQDEAGPRTTLAPQDEGPHAEERTKVRISKHGFR